MKLTLRGLLIVALHDTNVERLSGIQDQATATWLVWWVNWPTADCSAYSAKSSDNHGDVTIPKHQYISVRSRQIHLPNRPK